MVLAPGTLAGNSADGTALTSDLVVLPSPIPAGAATWGEGDFNGDTLVNSTDLYAMLAANQFNQGPDTTTTATPLATFPEPSAFALAALAALGLMGLMGLLASARRGRATKVGYPVNRDPLDHETGSRLRCESSRPAKGRVHLARCRTPVNPP